MGGEICPKMEFVPPIIFPQVQYCVKFEKAMQGIADQEGRSKLTINIT